MPVKAALLETPDSLPLFHCSHEPFVVFTSWQVTKNAVNPTRRYPHIIKGMPLNRRLLSVYCVPVRGTWNDCDRSGPGGTPVAGIEVLGSVLSPWALLSYRPRCGLDTSQALARVEIHLAAGPQGRSVRGSHFGERPPPMSPPASTPAGSEQLWVLSLQVCWPLPSLPAPRPVLCPFPGSGGSRLPGCRSR